MLVLTVSFIGLTGYAYANNTDPFSVIKRWVVGDEARVIYHDPKTNTQRQFSYGAKRSYSDLAISAFAEVSLIDLLHFHATNTYTKPKSGVEYISDPFRTDYHSPRVGKIEQITESQIVIHLIYSMSRSKMGQSADISERITVPRGYFYYYKEGKQAVMGPDAIGVTVEVFQNQYLEHLQNSGKRPTPVDIYSAFVLTHSLEAIKEATATTSANRARHDQTSPVSEHDLYELNVGALAEVCMNNGADTCPQVFKNEDKGQNFFHPSITPAAYPSVHPYNPESIPFGSGEGVARPTTAAKQYQLRYIEGDITAISKDRITVKTSSSAQWTFQYSARHQEAFAKAYGSPLQTGQHLAGAVIASVYDWDKRSFGASNVYVMSRY